MSNEPQCLTAAFGPLGENAIITSMEKPGATDVIDPVRPYLPHAGERATYKLRENDEDAQQAE